MNGLFLVADSSATCLPPTCILGGYASCGLCWIGTDAACRAFRRRNQKKSAIIVTATTPAATPTPIPAFAPDEGPDELFAPAEPCDDVDVGETWVAVAEAVAGTLLKSVDCHRISIPKALIEPGELISPVELVLEPSEPVQVYVYWVITSEPGPQAQTSLVHQSAESVAVVGRRE